MTLAGKLFYSGLIVAMAGWGFAALCFMGDCDPDSTPIRAGVSVGVAGLVLWPIAGLVDIWGTP